MAAIEVVAPTELVEGDNLRQLVVHCIEWGRMVIGRHGGDDRMAERHITGGEILDTLTRGVLTTDQCVAGRWRYSARRNDVEIIFLFEVDDDGNMLVIVTLMRKD